MGSPISIADLDRLDGELLPERAMLSTVSTPFNNSHGHGHGHGGGSSASAAQTGGGHSSGHGATVINSCQTTTSHGTPGLLGSLGLGSSNPYTTTTCSPAAVSSN